MDASHSEGNDHHVERSGSSKSLLKFDERVYWKSRNDYVFEDPVYNSTAITEMLKAKKKGE